MSLVGVEEISKYEVRALLKVQGGTSHTVNRKVKTVLLHELI